MEVARNLPIQCRTITGGLQPCVYVCDDVSFVVGNLIFFGIT